MCFEITEKKVKILNQKQVEAEFLNGTEAKEYAKKVWVEKEMERKKKELEEEWKKKEKKLRRERILKEVELSGKLKRTRKESSSRSRERSSRKATRSFETIPTPITTFEAPIVRTKMIIDSPASSDGGLPRGQEELALLEAEAEEARAKEAQRTEEMSKMEDGEVEDVGTEGDDERDEGEDEDEKAEGEDGPALPQDSEEDDDSSNVESSKEEEPALAPRADKGKARQVSPPLEATPPEASTSYMGCTKNFVFFCNPKADEWWEDQPVEPESPRREKVVEEYGEVMRDMMVQLEKQVAERVVTLKSLV